MLSGLKTLILNGSIIAGIAFLQFVVGADMSGLDPTIGVVTVAAANFGLRFLTKTPVGK